MHGKTGGTLETIAIGALAATRWQETALWSLKNLGMAKHGRGRERENNKKEKQVVFSVICRTYLLSLSLSFLSLCLSFFSLSSSFLGL
jgi:hypothetical protein